MKTECYMNTLILCARTFWIFIRLLGQKDHCECFLVTFFWWWFALRGWPDSGGINVGAMAIHAKPRNHSWEILRTDTVVAGSRVARRNTYEFATYYLVPKKGEWHMANEKSQKKRNDRILRGLANGRKTAAIFSHNSSRKQKLNWFFCVCVRIHKIRTCRLFFLSEGKDEDFNDACNNFPTFPDGARIMWVVHFCSSLSTFIRPSYSATTINFLFASADR